MKNVDSYKWFQMSKRQRMSPLPNVYSMQAISKEMNEVLGIAYEAVLILFEGNMMWVFFDEKDWARIEKFGLNKLKNDPKIFAKMTNIIEKHSEKFLDWLKEIRDLDLVKLSNEEIVEYWDRYFVDYKILYSNYFPILSMENGFVAILKDMIKSKAKNKEAVSEYFNVLTTEPRAMVSRQEELSSLRLACEIIKNPKWVSLIKNLDEKNIKLDEELNSLIEEHERNYFWVTRDYEDPILTYGDIAGRLKKHLENGPVEKLERYETEAEELIEKREKITKELNLSEDEQEMFSAMRDGLHLKELRKKVVSLSLFYFDSVLEEIAGRTGLTFKQIRFLVGQDEVGEALEGKSYKDISNDRIKRSAHYVFKGDLSIYSSKNAEEIFNDLVKVDENTKELKGFPASAGKAVGSARIVMNPDECINVKPGEIIVTTQAVPSFSSAISISAGMVCDGGTAITSHPATLAREAKIPCVTGTKIATQVIKDGDRIEVDGSLGIVRKL